MAKRMEQPRNNFIRGEWGEKNRQRVSERARGIERERETERAIGG